MTTTVSHSVPAPVASPGVAALADDPTALSGTVDPARTEPHEAVQ